MIRFFLLLSLAVCSACTQLVPPPVVSAVTTDTIPDGGLPPFDPSQPEAVSSSSWDTLAVGIEQRVIVPPQSALAQMVALRLDPSQVGFRVHYQPGNPLTLAEWQTNLPDAVIIINANFFTPENIITGMLVSDGQVFGNSFTDRGGMFSIQAGQPVIQSLIGQPYDGRPLEQAVQAFPMLVIDSLPAYTTTTDTRGSRRTVIGVDTAGRVLLLATPGIGLGLYDLSQYLASTDLELQTAFNLDGGGSTMLSVASTGYAIAPFDPVPAVLAVYIR